MSLAERIRLILNSIPPVTRNIFLINLLMFIATQINPNYMIQTFALFYPMSPFFEPWQIVTHAFMHGGFLHIFLNMYALLYFGSIVERSIGSKKFTVLYTLAALGAVLLHFLVFYIRLYLSPETQYYINEPTLGASGAIFGIFVAFAMIYPEAELTLIFPPITLKAKWFMLIFVAIELLAGIGGFWSGIAHFAHLGGALVAYIVMYIWIKNYRLNNRDTWI